jgi:hypothetical protein
VKEPSQTLPREEYQDKLAVEEGSSSDEEERWVNLNAQGLRVGRIHSFIHSAHKYLSLPFASCLEREQMYLTCLL